MSLINPPSSKPDAHPDTRRFLFDFPLDPLSLDDLCSKVHSFFLSPHVHSILTLNTLMILEGDANPDFRDACRKASLSIADSSGVSWAAPVLGLGPVERIPGIDLAFSLLKLCANENRSVYLLGGKPGVAKDAAEALKASIPHLTIAGFRDGYFQSGQSASVVDDILAKRADFILVALGMPKQELWIDAQRDRFSPGTVLMGVGGSFDVWAGLVPRAPRLFQGWGVEWLYRTIKEPFRWQRILQLPRFFWKVMRFRFAKSAQF